MNYGEGRPRCWSKKAGEAQRTTGAPQRPAPAGFLGSEHPGVRRHGLVLRPTRGVGTAARDAHVQAVPWRLPAGSQGQPKMGEAAAEGR